MAAKHDFVERSPSSSLVNFCAFCQRWRFAEEHYPSTLRDRLEA